MTEAVFDANLLAALVLDLPYSLAARQVAEHYDGVTSEQSLPEVATAIVRAVRTKAMSPDDAAAALTTAMGFAKTARMAGMERDALRLALLLDHTAYDCFYLRLAEQRGCPFATADKRFLKKAAHIATVPLLDLFALPEALP